MSMGFVKSAYIKENFGGNKMFKKLKDKKGFTLVELIVVLVILAILAALLIPALTGYIDKANKQKIVSETRMVVMAAQTELSEAYGKAGAGKKIATSDTDNAKLTAAITTLAEIKGEAKFKVEATESAKITKVTYDDGNFVCVFNASDNTYDTQDRVASGEGANIVEKSITIISAD